MFKYEKIFILVFLLLCSLFLVGCWDAREINTLFIVTGIAIDKSEQEGFLTYLLLGLKLHHQGVGANRVMIKIKKLF